MIIAGVIILSIYCLLLVWVAVGFYRLPVFSSESDLVTATFSIIIPFRNEEENLTALLDSLKILNYPETLFEIIFVDDESTDGSVEIIEREILRFALHKNKELLDKTEIPQKSKSYKEIRLLKNERISASPKKDAITAAIAIAKYEWILTTDADCMVPQNWLLSFNTFIQKNNYQFIAAPVALKKGKGLLQNFQVLDYFSLQGLTMGSFGNLQPLLCNGANVCYKKSLFKKLNGFTGNSHIASGDDIFMLEKALQHDASIVGYIKSRNSVVVTNVQKSWSQLLNQRVRWAGKTSKQQNVLAKSIGIVVFFMNLWLVVFVVLLQKDVWVLLLTLLIVKMLVDFFIILLAARFFRREINYFYYFLSSLLYPIFTVVVVLKSITGNYTWKGRDYKTAS